MLIIEKLKASEKMSESEESIAHICQERKIPTIAITSFGENTLSQMASCTLTMSTKESMFHNISDFSSHLSVHLILDILYSTYFLMDYDHHYQTKLVDMC